MPTVSDLEYDYLGAQGATGTLLDRRSQIYIPDEFTYWVTASGLTPAQSFSVTDHKRKAMQSSLLLTDAQVAELSTSDLSVLYWTP